MKKKLCRVLLTVTQNIISDAVYVGDIKKTGEFRIPNGIISFPGATESESKIHVILEKVSDITHFNVNDEFLD